MAGVDLDKVLGALSDGNSGIKENSDSLLGLAREVNNVLTEFEKSIKMLESMHVLPAIIRGVGKKFDIDVESPLHSTDSIEPSTEYHKMVYDSLNGMSEKEIGQVLLDGIPKEDEKKNEVVKKTE